MSKFKNQLLAKYAPDVVEAKPMTDAERLKKQQEQQKGFADSLRKGSGGGGSGDTNTGWRPKTDKERVKERQLSKEQIKEMMRRKGDGEGGYQGTPDYTSPEKPRAQKQQDGTIKFPTSLVKEALREAEPLHKFTAEEEKLLKDTSWIEPGALENIINRYHPKHESHIKDYIIKHAKEGAASEPYVGMDLHNILYSKHKRKKDIQHPKPAHVKDLKGTLGKDVPTGGPDPFMWLDTKYKVTQKLLEKNKGKPLQINTRSDLIGHDDYIAAMDPQKHVINMHVMTTNPDFNRRVEVGAPSVKRRMMAVKKLHDAGFKVYIVIDKLENPKLHDLVKQLMATEMDVKRLVPPGVKMKENKVKITDKQAADLFKAAKDTDEYDRWQAEQKKKKAGGE